MPIVDRLWYTLGLDSKDFNRGAKSADRQTDKLAGSIKNKLTTAIKGLVGAYLGFKAIGMTKELAVIGAQAERLTKSFNSIAESYGLNSRKIMVELRALSAETVSDIQLMTQASSAAIMGLSMKDLPKLMEIARAAAIAFNKSTSFMFESIVLGIARQSRMILDNLGIIINQEEIYKAKTERLGRALTDAEKKQIFFNEALKQGQNIIARVGTTTESSADKQEKLTASYENTKAAFGLLINKIIDSTGLLDTATEIIEGIAEAFGKLADNAEDAKKTLEELYALTRDEVSDTETAIKELNVEMVNAIIEQGNYWDKVKEVLDDNNISIQDLRKAWLDYGADFSNIDDDTYDAIKNYMELQTQIEKLRTKILELGATFDQTVIGEKPLIIDFNKMTEGKYIQGLKKFFKEALAEAKKFNEQFRKYLDYDITSDLGGLGVKPLLAQEPPTEIISQWQLFWEDIEYTIGKEGQDLLAGAFMGIRNHLNDFANDMIDIFSGILSGNFVQVGYSLVSIMDSLFGGESAEEKRQAQARLAEVLKQVAQEIERNINALERMTYAQRENRREWLESKIAYAESPWGNVARMMSEEAQALYEGWLAELGAINAVFSDEAALRGMRSFREFLDYLSEPSDLDYQKGKTLIDHFADVWELTAQQQIELYEMLLETLRLAGNLTLQQEWAIEDAIRRLQEQGIDPSRDIGGSQIYRSVTTITEMQANLMLGVLNSIHAEIRHIIELFHEAIGYMSQGFGGGGGTIIYGGINIYGSTNSDDVMETLTIGLRANGVRLG